MILKDRKIRHIEGARVFRNLVGMKGITKGYLFVAYGVPVEVAGENVWSVPGPVSLSCYSKRYYKVRFLAGQDYTGSYELNNAP